MRTQPDLDGGSFEAADAAPPMTLQLLAAIQYWMRLLSQAGNGIRGTSLWSRLERAESYLIERNNRDEDTR